MYITANPIKARSEKLPERRVSILCGIERHRYCSEKVLGDGMPPCDCTCHTEAVVTSTILNFAYNIHRVGVAISFMEAEERTERILDLIEAAQGVVDFHGMGSQEIFERLQGTLSRDYWSSRETSEDFSIDPYSTM